MRQRIPSASTLVIVRDVGAFLHIIGEWSPMRRFPILLDDGTDEARDNIARFTRGFAPQSIIIPDGDSPALEGPQAIPSAADAAINAAWDTGSPEALLAYWTKVGWAPPGIVITAADDPAWPAAVALAAGRGQRIAWIDAPAGDPNSVLAADALRTLDGAIRSALAATPHTWRAIGDDIDAITICANTPARCGDPKAPLALTDALGRHPDGERYAWAGQVIGDSQHAIYRAMCSLFIPPRSAWLFDGYEADFAPPYSTNPAAEVLTSTGFAVINDAPGPIATWRRRAAAISAGSESPGFIHANSSGHPSSFTLIGGRAHTADIPALPAPAIVHFIHSFSAKLPASDATIAGRWLANGCYAYIGAVDEPLLGAFRTPDKLARRLLVGMPLAAAIRTDDSREPVWKITLLGDPLTTFPANPAPTIPPVELESVHTLEADMQSALRDQRFPQALRMLTMLNRHADAADVARAIMKRDGGTILDPDTARHALPAALRSGDGALLGAVYASLDPRAAAHPRSRDALWIAASLHLAGQPPELLISTLRANARDAMALHDARALGPHLARLYGPDAARSLFLELADRAADPKEAARLREEASEIN